jgi:uncharacterized membrane protein YeaQ/YmgE (transglycosylase-associated protein family)
MNLILWCVTGALIALLASLRTTTLGHQRLLVEVAFSGLGAVVGGMLATPSGRWLSFETHWQGIAAAIVGAVMLLGVANFRAMRGRIT